MNDFIEKLRQLAGDIQTQTQLEEIYLEIDLDIFSKMLMKLATQSERTVEEFLRHLLRELEKDES